MGEIFIKLLNMSISAGWVVLAVIIARLLLRRAPKWVSVIMWALVGLRLICPFSLESALSLIPSAETVPQNIVYADVPTIHTGIGAVNSTVNPIISESFAPNPGDSVNPLGILTEVSAYIWVIGIAAMLIYTAVSYNTVCRRVREAIPHEGRIMLCDRVRSPFILGIIRPRIYLPSDIDPTDMEYVIAHEKAHLRRGDYLWKPLGFLLLSVYWFNPLMWVAYILLCRDIESACDERVLRTMGDDAKAPYSEALIKCSVPRRVIAACPLAFGEVGVKSRIKSVMNYKKPAFWVIIASLVLCIVLAVCFLTDPKAKSDHEDFPPLPICDSQLEGVAIELIEADIGSEYPYLKMKWYNSREDAVIFGNRFDMYRYEDGKWVDARDTGEFAMYFTLEGYLCPPGSTAEKSYPLSYVDMTKAGKYKFVTYYSINDGYPENYEISLEIEVTEPTAGEFELTLPGGTVLHNLATSYLDSLRRIYPQYFGLDTSKGLEVYWYQMARDNYNWVLVPGRNSQYTWQPLMDLPPATTQEMRAIVYSYGLDESEISILRTWAPHSSYVYMGDPVEHAKYVEEMFWNTSPMPEESTAYRVYSITERPIYDELIFDIDRDGVMEVCQIGMGPTSGLFTFTLTAIENGEEEYSGVFHSHWGDLSFEESSDGTVRICIKSYNTDGDATQLYYYDISVVDGRIILTDENGEIEYLLILN
ncbi:MAG: hypothetical protein IKV39_03710 [Clostridia bacterium]|nr:hypothetical protein [Clostridia bacterium]